MTTNRETLPALLREYNRWRRGDETLEQPNPAKISAIIDGAADRLEQHGNPADAADPNGSTCARLKWWKDRADDLHDQLAAKDGHADEIYKAAVDLAKKLEDDLASERALADRLASELSACKNTFGIEFGGTTEALAAWKEARRDP